MATFYDTHAHLSYPDFAHELPELLSRAHAAGIEKIVTIATDLATSEKAIALTEQFSNVFAAVGWHPSDVLEAPEDIRDALRNLAQHPKVVAIGETGLDYYRLPSQKSGGTKVDDENYKRKQAAMFQQQLEIAGELKLNCVVHQRSSLQDTLDQFAPFASRVRAVFHCFAEDVPTMRRIIEMGSIVSFTGILTFKNGQGIRDTLAATPMDAFMLETDSPFLAPVPYRGKRCEPAYVKETAAVAAQVKNCTLEQLSEATCATAHKFFSKLSS